MSNEIQAVFTISAQKSNLVVSKRASKRLDMSGADWSGQTMDLNEVETLLTIPSNLVTLGWGFFRNLSTSAVIQIGVMPTEEYSWSFTPFFQLQPGEFGGGPLATTGDLAARTVSGTGKLELLILER